MQYVLFHFKVEPIKPLPTYLQRQAEDSLYSDLDVEICGFTDQWLFRPIGGWM